MPASALLKFTQGATVGADGQALIGVLTTSVALSNVNNASVASWQIDLVYVDPVSSIDIAVPYAFNNASSTPAANFAPDVRRSYRWVLKVWSVPNRVGTPDDVDIRVFTVRETNGAIIPPSQLWPLPLPDPRSGIVGAKPNEMNFGGQLDGWHGTGTDGLLSDLLTRHMLPLPGPNGEVATVVGGKWASAPASGGSGSVPLTAVLYVDPGRTTSTEDGSSSQPFKTAQAAVNYGITLPVRKFTVLLAYGDYTAQDLTITAPELGGPNSCVIIGLGGSHFHNNGGPLVTLNNIVVNNGSESGNFWTEFHNIACNDLSGVADLYLVHFLALTFTVNLCAIFISAYDLAQFLAYGTGSEPSSYLITDGDVVSPGTAVADNEIVVFDQTTGRFIKSSGTTVAALQASADHNPFMETDLAKGGSFTLALTDLYKKIRCTAALTITVPLHATVALPVGIRIPLLADVAGLAQVTVAPFSGAVTVKKAASLALTLREQGSPAELWQQATDVWWLLGDLTVSP